MIADVSCRTFLLFLDSPICLSSQYLLDAKKIMGAGLKKGGNFGLRYSTFSMVVNAINHKLCTEQDLSP